MVAGRIPLQRRLRAWSRKILAFLFWLGAAGTSAVLYTLQPQGSTLGIAQVELYPLRAGVSGKVAELQVREGQRVEEGQVLGRIEVPGLAQQISAAEAELTALEGTLAVGGADRDRRYARDLDGARARWLSATVALRDQEAQMAELDVQYARMTQPGLDLPALEIESLKVRRDALGAAISARKAEVDALQGDMERAQARARGALDPAVQAQLDTLRGQLEALRAQQAAGVLTAPHAGVVGRAVSERTEDPLTERTALPTAGTWVEAGSVLLTVTEASTREAVVWMDPVGAGNLKTGQQLTLLGSAGSTSAKVEHIGPAVLPVPPQSRMDPLVLEWKIPVTVMALERDLIPGEPLVVDF